MCRMELNCQVVIVFEDVEGFGIRLLIDMIRHAEHPHLIDKQKSGLTEDECRELRFFHPACLSVEDWDGKNLDVSLKNIEDGLTVGELNH